MNVNVLVILIVAVVFDACVCHDPSPYIIKGRDAKPGEVPWIVSLSTHNGNHFCGGSIINARHILTAAHCVYGMKPIAQQLKARAGSLVLNTNGTLYNIKGVDIHPYFNPNTADYDVAILHTDRDIAFTNSPVPVKEVKLPQGLPELHEYTVVQVAGWGYFSVSGETLATNLQIANITIHNQTVCELYYEDNNFLITERTICAGMPGMGTCKGDSGGPLTHNGILYGIVSWGIDVCTIKPSVFADVVEMMPWITSDLALGIFNDIFDR